MADYIRFDNDGNIVIKYQSVDGSAIKDDANVLKVDRVTISSITKFHKVEGGQVVLMTQAEKDTLLQVEADAREQTLLARIDKYEVSNLDLLTALVKRINIRIPNNPITKAEVIQQIKDDLGL